MKRLLCLMILSMPLLSKAQGIQFEQGLTWDQVKQKAKTENKYIFMDCAASWCVPCKKMDKEVFPLKNVGDYMNANFISVHVQMDTSKNDDENIKAWYAEAKELQQQFTVKAFPTYLFFSPEGKLVHHYMYSLVDSEFLKTAANALDPNHQYSVLLENYLSGKKDYSKLPYLSTMSKNMGDDSLATVIAKDYLHNYLNKQSEKEIFQKKNFQFINAFPSLLTSNDKIFSLLNKDSKKIDELMGKDFSQGLVVGVLTKEDIEPKLWPNKKPIDAIPDWNMLTKTVRKKANTSFADLSIIYAQLKWYHQKKDRQQEIKYTIKKFENYGLDTAGIGWAIINNIAYELFLKYCNNKDTLTKMIHWMELVNSHHPDDQGNMDTYANLLYKVGKKEEATSWETKALELETAAAKKENRQPDPGYKDALDKMKRGLPTW